MSSGSNVAPPRVFWFLPTSGDSRYLGSDTGNRAPDLVYLRQVAQAADALGYYGVLLPTGRTCEDSWIIASALAPATQRLRFLVAARPGLMSPAVAARMTATLDRISDGRILINIVAGGDPVEAAAEGLFLPHDERYELTREFVAAYRALLQGEIVNHSGKYVRIEDGRLAYLPVQKPHPPLYFGGSSGAGIAAAAGLIDVYLTWGEPPADVKQKLETVRRAFACTGRKVSFGIRLHVIVRETTDAAWAAAETLISELDEQTIALAQAVLTRFDSVGQKRMSALHGWRKDKLEVSPNLWTGIGLIRGGAGTALVGDPDIVAERIREYQSLGIESFILSGYPHLEEAYRFAELVFPKLGLKWQSVPGPVNTGPFGEIIATQRRRQAHADAS